MSEVFSEYYNQKDTDRYYGQDRQEMLEFIPAHAKKILDVGCSAGLFGAMLKQKLGCEVWGIEPHTESYLKAKERLDVAINDIFHRGLVLETKFDCIVFNDVLEHLSDPWDALMLSKELLNEKGCIVASIPNIRCYSVTKDLLLKGEFSYAPSGILDKTHLRFFTKKSIEEMFANCGYAVNKIEGMYSVLGTSRLLRMLIFFFPKKLAGLKYTSYGITAQVK